MPEMREADSVEGTGEGRGEGKGGGVVEFEPRAVLFDFDGVIVNSEPLHFQAMWATLKGEGVELTDAEYYEELLGFDDRGAFRKVYEKRGRELLPKTLLALVAAKGRRMKEAIERRTYRALPGVDELVRALWRHYPLAICSGALREEIEAMLEGIKLRDCFPVITAAEDVTVGKPDPSGYLQTVGALTARLPLRDDGTPAAALKAEQCLVIEDAPSVIRNVKAAGFKTLGVAGSYPLTALGEADAAVGRLCIESVAKALPAVRLGV